MKVTELAEAKRLQRDAYKEARDRVKASVPEVRDMCTIQRGAWAALIYLNEYDGTINIAIGSDKTLLDDNVDIKIDLPRPPMSTEFKNLLNKTVEEALEWVQDARDEFPEDNCSRKQKEKKK